ncbi:PI-PLC X domain-containing protein 3 [Cimex lectularius]|uniref:Phosphatidylinositol-specific phospholipase C X domain-containing protein n=1 Tax=Cimex lectularius TaxID=79782 RepID=A0A8I6RX82_CIMLE|nr:PI-PLC X domain-containing protein 3 [Cimex lectularius]
MSIRNKRSKQENVIQPLTQLISYIEETTILSDWMSQLPAERFNIPLIYLAIPGSHNSLTYTIKKYAKFSPDVTFLFKKPIPVCIRPLIFRWCKTQDLSIRHQLENGIRYIDVRICTKQKSLDLFIAHGMYGGTVRPELEEINTFLNSHPKEVIIIDFQHFHSMDKDHHDRLIDIIKATFGSKICPVPPTSVESATLNYMHSNNYQVIIIYRSNTIICDIFWRGTQWPTFWPATMNPKDMINMCENAIRRRKSSSGLVSQGVLTAKATTIMCPTGSVRKSCAHKALIPMMEWLNHCYKDNLRVNVVIADFVNYHNNLLIKGVISLNYREQIPQLEIG